DFSNQQLYTYASGSQRLATEQLNIDGSHTWTNSFAYDKGQASGLGVLTKESGGVSGSGVSPVTWTGGVDSLSRVNAETNTVINLPATGDVNGPCTVTA